MEEGTDAQAFIGSLSLETKFAGTTIYLVVGLLQQISTTQDRSREV